MKGVEQRGTIAVRGKVLIRSIGTNRTKGEISPQYFEQKFLQAPCLACCSPTHSFLKETRAGGTRSDLKRYTGECPIAIIDRIYDPDSDEFDIAFWLPANRFARDCGYDLDVATSRMPPAFVKEGEGIRQHAQSFYNEVRGRCLANGWTEPVVKN